MIAMCKLKIACCVKYQRVLFNTEGDIIKEFPGTKKKVSLGQLSSQVTSRKMVSK